MFTKYLIVDQQQTYREDVQDNGELDEDEVEDKDEDEVENED